MECLSMTLLVYITKVFEGGSQCMTVQMQIVDLTLELTTIEVSNGLKKTEILNVQKVFPNKICTMYSTIGRFCCCSLGLNGKMRLLN